MHNEDAADLDEAGGTERRTKVMMSAMRRFLILGAAWTGLVVAVLLLLPLSSPAMGCWRLVVPTAGCVAELAQVNDGIWWTQTLPMLALFASGYVIIGLLAIRRVRRPRS